MIANHSDLEQALAQTDSRLRVARQPDTEAVIRLHRGLASEQWEGCPKDLGKNLAAFLKAPPIAHSAS